MIAIAISLAAMTMCISCEKKSSADTQQVSNIAFTTCLEAELYVPPEKFSVDFTNSGVDITHYLLDVNCAFDTVLVTSALKDGILMLFEQGEPNTANCICKTNVSYTVSGISEEDIQQIVINGEEAWAANILH